jgi:hypothetical protein
LKLFFIAVIFKNILMFFSKKLLFLAALIIAASCVAYPNQIATKTTQIAALQNLSPKIYETKNFKIFTLQKITNPNQPLRIYFEGDGKAFTKKNVASPNPTPTSYFLINLIAQDSHPNIIYIARPCQFVEEKKCYRNNPEKYWTSERFSDEVLDSINEVVSEFSNFKLELIGYSGGATVAKYIAAKNQIANHNIINFRTIAGNISNKKFSELHNVKELESPESDKIILHQLENIPQIHFIGNDDEITPVALAKSYVDNLSRKDCVKIIHVEGVSHSSGWQNQWAELLKIKPVCDSTKVFEIKNYETKKPEIKKIEVGEEKIKKRYVIKSSQDFAIQSKEIKLEEKSKFVSKEELLNFQNKSPKKPSKKEVEKSSKSKKKKVSKKSDGKKSKKK